MPNMQWSTSGSSEKQERRFKVVATGEIGRVVSKHGLPNAIGRYVTIGTDLNVDIFDLCFDETGEIRSYRSDRLEEIKD